MDDETRLTIAVEIAKETAKRLESENRVLDYIQGIQRNITSLHQLISALHDTVSSMPGYNPLLFAEMLRQHGADSTEKMRRDLKAAETALQKLLKDYEGEPQ